MESWFSKNKVPFINAVGVFLLTFCSVILLAVYYDFSKINLEGLLFLSAFLCCIFISKNTYDLSKASIIQSEIKESLKKDFEVASDELYLQLYKNSPVPYLIIDMEGHVRSANIAAVRMFGERQTKVRGLNVFKRIAGEDQDSHLDFLKEKFRSGVPISNEVVKVDRPDKQEKWGLLSLFVYKDSLGEKVGLLTLVDITRQKRAEDAKSEFVSLASHQLRTPIAGMKWSAELLLVDDPESLSARQKKYIDRLLVSIRRMALLVDDFLRVSRFELGTFKPEFTTVSLPDLFDDVIEEQSSRVKQKKLIVKKFYDASVKEMYTDPNLVRMIVTNLYSNATKYTNESGTVHIGYERKEDELVITVADNGMGIPVEDQGEIFSKLFRASNAARNVPDGTGLGLYILRQAISVLKGNVTFTTTENVGTTFEVTLPYENVN